MTKLFRTIGAGIAIIVSFFYLGCGSIPVANAAGGPGTAPLTIATKLLPSAIAGTPYVAALDATGGTPTYKWTIGSGQLPPGVTLESTNGVITGTPTASGNFSVGLKLSDASNPTQSKTSTVTISVAPAPLQIATTTLAAASYGAAYTQSLQATGGTPAYSWSITSGSLPSGLALGASTGVISGHPTAAGSWSFTVTVRDSGRPAQTQSASFSLSVAGTPLQIVTPAMAAATVGAGYTQTLQATGGKPGYQWAIVSGNLPAGLTLAPSTGVISGTPTASGKASFVAAVSDSSSPAQTTTGAFTISVAPTPVTAAVPAIPSVKVGGSVSQTLQASGGTAPYAWTIASGSLPAGVTLSPSGTLSGAPTTSGNYAFTAAVTDSSSPSQYAAASGNIVVAPTPIIITSSSMLSDTVGTAYSQALTATGGTAPYTWSVTKGSLPAGLSLTSSNGMISGTPVTGGTASFTATVVDSSSPAQSASVTTSIAIVGSPLSITTQALPAPTAGSAYVQQLQAVGGTAPYTWAVSGGSLPAGLSLSSTGLITGVATSGGSSFTVSVSDSSSPALIASATLSIAGNASASTVAAPALAVASSALPAGTVGVAYAQTVQASGGTPAYTWTISSGSLPAGLSMAATTGTITGTPTTSGTSSFTVTVTDNSNPAQTQSVSTSISIGAAASASSGHTWYVDAAIGGTRYSTNMPNGLCDGTADAAPVGTTPNQHCAFSDVRMLYQDGSYVTSPSAPFPAWGWIGQGGDTYYIMGSIASGVSYRVGPNNVNASCDATGCWGIVGTASESGVLAPPSGTASHHTKVYAGCMITSTCSASNPSTLTQLHGGWGTGNVLSLYGVSYVDVAGFDITDFSNCSVADATHFPCENNGQVISDYALNGIQLYGTTNNTTLNHMHIHGLGAQGISGPTGTGFVANDIQIIGNAIAGWNADPGDGTTGVGTLNVTNFNISWNGCAEEYPIVDPLPYASCQDDSGGGYGDGFGTTTVTSPSPWNVTFQSGVVSYNTQDGLDALHINCPGCSITEEQVLAYGNEGQQLKAGDGAVPTLINNVIVGNCDALGQTMPGRPNPTYDNIGDLCRAGNVPVVFFTVPGTPSVYRNNTIFTQGAIGVEIEYSGETGSDNTVLFDNNIFVGFYNNGSQDYPSPIFSNGGGGGVGGASAMATLANPGSSWTNNATYGYKSNWTCPGTAESNAICGNAHGLGDGISPGLVDMTFHQTGYGNMAPASASSAVVGAGTTIPGILVDYTGYTRPNPPSIGAYEYQP